MTLIPRAPDIRPIERGAGQRRAEAHDLLAPVYNWFTEGSDSLDLQGARDVLAKLGEPHRL